MIKTLMKIQFPLCICCMLGAFEMYRKQLLHPAPANFPVQTQIQYLGDSQELKRVGRWTPSAC